MIRRAVGLLALGVAIVLSLMPIITGEHGIAVQEHHLDHATLIFLGAVAGLALFRFRDRNESPAWIWVTVLCPIVAMFLMAPPLYAMVDPMPWLHSIDHLVFVGLAFATAYAGQRYVAGVGWASALLLESMAIVAAYGYGVAPPLAVAAPAAVASARPVSSIEIARGATIFAQNCAACHGAHGEGGMGPSLKNEGTRKDLTQAEAWIEHPAPPMPTLYPNPLSAKDVEAVASYVETLR